MIDEGVTKFKLDWLKGPTFNYPSVHELIKWRTPLWLAGLIGIIKPEEIGFGNMSARVANKFVITGTQTGGIRQLENKHFSLVTDYSQEENRIVCVGPIAASSESLTHASLYDLNWSIQAVVHVHSERLWNDHIYGLPTTSAVVPYGTPAMAYELELLYKNSTFAKEGVAVMGGHQFGLIAIGVSVQAAVRRITELLT